MANITRPDTTKKKEVTTNTITMKVATMVSIMPLAKVIKAESLARRRATRRDKRPQVTIISHTKTIIIKNTNFTTTTIKVVITKNMEITTVTTEAKPDTTRKAARIRVVTTTTTTARRVTPTKVITTKTIKAIRDMEVTKAITLIILTMERKGLTRVERSTDSPAVTEAVVVEVAVVKSIKELIRKNYLPTDSCEGKRCGSIVSGVVYLCLIVFCWTEYNKDLSYLL
ncbi:uncharacterized protein LOC114325675 isoform X2 [Diabrotica virgifera virgifera]|uniref:Uncharacterized protein n=1 Tax=Diabrotica virgifera virgifera TaxID=50390 RepID=A0ABM5JWK3_DIAVI|nr:uncharacterized protein LOC114325675 isoform X2 [Diabrotica virgifera virgifera]